jgi:hypothetical protein
MTRRSKLLQKALADPATLRFQELCNLALQLGFLHDRTKGSHFIFKCSGLLRPLNFQDVDGLAKAFQVKQLLAAARELGLIDDEQ